MKRLRINTFIKILVCCILGWACFIICMETDNTSIMIAAIPTIIFVVLAFKLFEKLNKIIALLQEIADQGRPKSNKKD